MECPVARQKRQVTAREGQLRAMWPPFLHRKQVRSAFVEAGAGAVAGAADVDDGDGVEVEVVVTGAAAFAGVALPVGEDEGRASASGRREASTAAAA